jgi:hypothetical protein
MSRTQRIDATVSAAAEAPFGTASPLAAIHMTHHQRRQAEHDMRTAEQLVDFVFSTVAGWQGLVRRVRGLRLAH